MKRMDTCVWMALLQEKNAKKGNTSAREVPLPEITMDLDGTMDPLKYGVVKLPEEV
jgi:hypothetical protein